MKITDNAGDRNLWVIGIFLCGRSGLGILWDTILWHCVVACRNLMAKEDWKKLGYANTEDSRIATEKSPEK